MGEEVPLWDIRGDFPDDNGMLVVNNTIGSSMAKRLGANRACLPASHGAVIAETTIRRVVLVAINLVTNAELLMRSPMLTLTQGTRELRYLGSGEIRGMTELIFNPRALARMWEYWAARARHAAGEAAR
jgi:hypothetical protein